MKFVLLTNDLVPQTLKAVEGTEWVTVANMAQALAADDADAFFDLREDAYRTDHTSLKMPVFINSVIVPLSEIPEGNHITRINGWPGFLEKELWEVSGEVNEAAEKVLKALRKKYVKVNDEPGFVSARILSMIINEAFFAEEENVSSREDIDTAMKLGTNYPLGPFEWAKMIGEKRIFQMLKKLSATDPRYTPSAGLEASANKN